MQKITPSKFVNVSERGFTLIEMSIVLVIIGLIVGGVLVGQSLIAASTVRAQVTQIEKYNQAVNTFRGKYGYLPGDMPNQTATQFGFISRAGNCGDGDGNGLLAASDGAGGCTPEGQGVGETTGFWVDLSVAKLIDTNIYFPQGSMDYYYPSNSGLNTSPSISNFMPDAKIGLGNFVYFYNNGTSNYYGLSAVTRMVFGGTITSAPGLSPQQAYSMDKKIDDGFPQTGRVMAQYVTGNTGSVTISTNASSDSTTTCFNTSAPGYSLSAATNNGNTINCALSFQFQ